MKFIFAILKLRPLGGKERDFVGIVAAFAARGHEVTVLTSEAPDISLPDGVAVQIVPVRAWTNHGRHRAFAEALRGTRRQMDDEAVLIAFDRIPCADYLFVAGRPLVAGNFWKRAMPRHRAFADLERATFGAGGTAFAFFLTEDQAARYRARYGISEERFAVLPTTFGVGRALPRDYYGTRDAVRGELGIPERAPLLVHVGVNGHLKGLDRAIDLLPHLPDAHLIAVGDTSARFRWQARRHRVQARTHFIAYAADLPRLLGAADLLVHPARDENTGTVILESLLYGIPAVVAAECGYAGHVARSGAGSVVPAPFDQQALLADVSAALEPQRLEQFKAAARDYGPRLVAEGGIERLAEAMLATIRDRLQGLHTEVRRTERGDIEHDP